MLNNETIKVESLIPQKWIEKDRMLTGKQQMYRKLSATRIRTREMLELSRPVMEEVILFQGH